MFFPKYYLTHFILIYYSALANKVFIIIVVIVAFNKMEDH